MIPDVVEDWRARAACSDADPETFFPEKYRDERLLREARDHCDVCPVWETCLTLAVGVPGPFDRDGIFGGLTPAERADLRGPQPRMLPGEYGEWRGGDPDRRRTRSADVEDKWGDEAQSA